MQEQQNPVEVQTGTDKSLPQMSIANIGQIIAINVAVAYFCGFIIVTSFLGSFGIKDYDAFHIQYIISGTTLLLIIGFFVYLVGHRVFLLDDNSRSYLKKFQKLEANGKFWSFCAFVYPLIEIGFFIVFTVVSMSFFIFPITSTRTFWIVAIAISAALFDFIANAGREERLGKYYYLLNEIFYLITFLAFFYEVDGIISEFSGYVLDGFMWTIFVAFTDKYVVSRVSNSKYRLIIYSVLSFTILIGLSSKFGEHYYGFIRSSIGGGEPQQVQIVVDESDTPLPIINALKISKSISAKVDLIAQTDADLYIGYPPRENEQKYKSVIRVQRKLIRAVIANDLSVIKSAKIQ
jgi:hypothetical protein